MGIAATGYERVEYVRAARPQDGRDLDRGDADGLVLLWTPTRAADRSDGLRQGWYRPRGRQHENENTSYTWYGEWRAWLAAFGRALQARTGAARRPFAELTGYPDNEGFFGPATSRRLAEDFMAHKAAVREHAARTVRDRDRRVDYVGYYDTWGRVLARAGQTGHGAVVIH